MLIATLACAALVSIALIGLSWSRRDDTEVSAFMLLAPGAALWSGVRLMEVVTFDMSARVGWVRVAYLGTMIVPTTWLRMVVGPIRSELNALSLARVGQVLTLPVAIAFIGLVATNELYHLVQLGLRFVVLDGVKRAVFDHGRMFRPDTAYNYVLLAISLVLLVLPIDEGALDLYVSSRMQVRLALVIGQLLPLVAYLAYLQHRTTALGGDLTPATFAVSTALLGRIILQSCLRDTAVYARGRIVEAMRDGCIVLVHDGSIASVNAAVRYLLPIARVHAMPPAVLDVAGILREFEWTCLPNRHQVWLPEAGRTLEVTLEGPSDVRGRYAGVFLLLRDVTVEQLQRAGMVSAQNALRSELWRTQALLTVLEDDVNRGAFTYLFNRRFLETQTPRLFNHTRRDDRPVTLALFGIDCLKQYNDTYDHLQGDECLRMVADTSDMACRHPDDFIARVGGEEFVAMLFDLNRDDARQTVARVVAIVVEYAEPHAASVATPHVTLSVGVVTLMSGDERLDVLFERADAVLYDVKRNGRNTFRFHQGPPGLRSVAGREQTACSQGYATALLCNGKCIGRMDTCAGPPRMRGCRQQPNPFLEYAMPAGQSIATAVNHYLHNAELPKAISAQQAFQHAFDVYLKDSNACANTYFARYFEWQGVVRECWFHECIDAELLMSGRVIFVTKLAHQEFVEEAFPFQRVECHLNTFWVQPYSFYMVFRSVLGGRLVSLGYQQVVCANTERVTQRLPEHVRVRVKAHELDTPPELAHASWRSKGVNVKQQAVGETVQGTVRIPQPRIRTGCTPRVSA